jgi:hypothetical protein
MPEQLSQALASRLLYQLVTIELFYLALHQGNGAVEDCGLLGNVVVEQIQELFDGEETNRLDFYALVFGDGVEVEL